ERGRGERDGVARLEIRRRRQDAYGARRTGSDSDLRGRGELADRSLNVVDAGPIRRGKEAVLIDRRLGRPGRLRSDGAISRVANVRGELELGRRRHDDVVSGDDRDGHRGTRDELVPGVSATGDGECRGYDEDRHGLAHHRSLREPRTGSVSKGPRTGPLEERPHHSELWRGLRGQPTRER